MRLGSKRFTRLALLTVVVGGCAGLAASTAFVRSERGRQALAVMIGRVLGASDSASSGYSGYRVKLGSMGPPGLTRVVLRDIVVTTGDGSALLQIPRVELSYNPFRAFLAGGSPVSAVTGIKLAGPHLDLARDASGRWNIMSLLGGERTGSSFLANADARLKVTHGTVTVKGYSGLDGGVGTLDGSVHLDKGKISSKELSLLYQGARVTGDGWVDAVRGTLSAQVGFSDVDSSLVAALAGGAAKARFNVDGKIAGRAALSGRVSSPHADFQLTGRDISVGSQGQRLAVIGAAEAQGAYDDSALNISRASLKTGKTVVEGLGSIDSHGKLAAQATLRSDRLEEDLPRLASLITWTSGHAALKAQVSGTVSNPEAALALEVPEAIIYRLPVTSGTVQGRLNGGIFHVIKSSARLHGQLVSASGSVALKGKVSNLKLALSNVDISQVAGDLGLDLPIAGQAAVSARLVNGVNGLGRWTLTGSVKAQGLAYNAVRADTATAELSYNNGELKLTNGVLGIGDSRGQFQGVIARDARANVAFSIKDLQLADISKAAAGVDLSGIANVAGTVSFEAGKFGGAGRMTVNQPSYHRIDGDSLSARYELSDGSLTISNLALARGTAQYTGSATVSNLGSRAPNSTISGLLKVRGESIRELSSMTGSSALDMLFPGQTATIDGSVTVKGPVSDPNIKVDAVLPGRLMSATLGLRVRDGRLRVTSVGGIGRG